MNLKKKLKGLDENGIKRYFKISFIDDAEIGMGIPISKIKKSKIKKILKSKTFKKSKYIRSIFDEVLEDLTQTTKELEKNIEDPQERLNYLKNSIK